MLFRDLPGVTTCRFKQGEYLLRRGEPMPYVYCLKKGEVKREVLTPYGSEMINPIKVGGQITGSIVGLLEIYDSHFDGYCSDDFIAIEECVCYRVPVEVCMRYLGEHPELLAEALTMAIDLFDVMEALLLNKRDLKAPQLVCEFLLTHGLERAEGLVLPKKFNNVEIAKYRSMHSVTGARLMSALKREGVVVRTAEGWLLRNTEALHEYLDGTRKMKYD